MARPRADAYDPITVKPPYEAEVLELLVTSDPVRLSVVRSLLADAGIESFVFDGGSPWPGAVPSRLMIAEDDEAIARHALSAFDATSGDPEA